MKNLLTIDPRLKLKKNDVPMDLPVVIHVNEFKEASAKTFSLDMQKAHQSGQPIIPIVIDSYGGQVDALIHMISEIQNAEVPVATICQGKAMSCGSILLSFGTEGHRYCDVNSRIMIHDVSNMAAGKNEEIKAEASETDRLNKMIFNMMDKNCGQDRNFFSKEIHEKGHAEWYLTAQQAKKLNLINFIRVPTLRTSVEVTVEFG